MNLLKRFFSLLALLVLTACGGGGGSDAGTPPFGGGTGTGGGGAGATPSASDLVLSLSATSVSNSGSQTVVATAVAIDGNRNAITGVPVTIAVNSGGVVTPGGTVTDTTGTLSATIGIGSDHTTRTMTVTATSGSLTRTSTLQVVDAAGRGGTDPSALLLTLSKPSIANDGSETVTANVIALDAKHNVLPGVVVSISADSGTVNPSGSATDANGLLTATIGVGSDHSNRTINITAAAGSGLSATPVQLQVQNSSSPSSPTAADISLVLSASTLNNGGTSTILATATAVDVNRNALAGIPVTISVDANAVATVSSSKTDNNGVVTANVGIGSDRTNRTVNVTANSGTLSKTVPFSVIGAKLAASLSPVVVAGSTGNVIQYTLVDTNSLAMSGQPISVTSPGLPSQSGVTDVNGKYSFQYTAPAAAGNLTVIASAGGDSLSETVSVVPAGGGGVPPASEAPQSASLTPSPSVISVNLAGSTANQVELRALFVGANNNPIQNIRVRFDLAGNINNSDGVASQPGTYAYSDSSGVGRGTFTPGQISSPTNGVMVRACYATTDFDTSTCPNSVTNTLTVASEALSVNIRTNNIVDPNGAGGLTYIKQFVVMVVDAAGQAKPDVLITPSVDLPGYYKGFYAWNGAAWQQQVTLASSENWRYNDDPATLAWQQQGSTTQPSCPNEDANRNGVREAPVYDPNAAPPAVSARQEDLNWNGDLDPRKADVAITMVGSSTTDATGVAVLQIEYGKNLASWVDFVITVTASGISGTESRARYSGLLYGLGNLPFPAADVTDLATPPAFVISPYGRGTVCTDAK